MIGRPAPKAFAFLACKPGSNGRPKLFRGLGKVDRPPLLFFGHGSPMNALGGPLAEEWRAIGAELDKPKAVLMVSAHWYVPEVAVTAMEAPRTIHDFGGFPEPLYQVQYKAPGAPWLAERVSELLAPLRS